MYPLLSPIAFNMNLLLIVSLVFFATIIIIILVVQKLSHYRKKKNLSPPDFNSSTNQFDVFNGFSSKWLFSYNEKEALYQIKSVTDKLSLYLFAKVRLFDLIEPQRGTGKYKTLQNKIQSKHVDFVVCDQKLVARAIIELDDDSHNIASRQERDEFVHKVLTDCGYSVLRYKSINPELLEAELSVYNPVIKYI